MLYEFRFCLFFFFFFFSSRRRHTRFDCDWSSDVCSSDLRNFQCKKFIFPYKFITNASEDICRGIYKPVSRKLRGDRKSTRLNSSHSQISYAVFCLKKKKK